MRTTGEVHETLRARELWQQIAEAAWQCADPGVQYDDTIQRWHTCKATDRINATNPCVTGDTLVATADGWRRIDALVGRAAEVIGADGQPHPVTRIFPTGGKAVYRLRTAAGYEVRSPGTTRCGPRTRRRRRSASSRPASASCSRAPASARGSLRNAQAHRDRPRRPFPDDRPPLGRPRRSVGDPDLARAFHDALVLAGGSAPGSYPAQRVGRVETSGCR